MSIVSYRCPRLKRSICYTDMNMKIVKSLADSSVVSTLRRGGVVVARTDTIYGILARANDDQAVARVYDQKDRGHHKSPIMLIHDMSQLFDEPTEHAREWCQTHWPGKVTIVLPSTKSPAWIHRGNHSVAYRMPDHVELTTLIEQVGPLIAPSANPEGKVPAMTINQAVAYFGDEVDIYVDGGEVTDNTPSRILKVTPDGDVEQLR